MYLSKSKYTRGIQCPKILWMENNKREWFDDSVMNDAVLASGSAVGDVAMGYFGDYVEVSYDPADPNRFVNAIERTKELLQSGEKTICEATFGLLGQYCMVDILQVREDGSFDVIEVKSSTAMKDVYYHDLAYQCWLITECGYRISSASLMYVNNKYVRRGELDIRELFVIEDLTEDIRQMIPDVPSRIKVMSDIGDAESEPLKQIGMHCFKPYDCGYRDWCFRDLPDNNVFALGKIHKTKAFALVERGSGGFEDLVNDVESFERLNEKQQMQVLCELNDLGPVVDKEAIAQFLAGLSYPLYFLDFETYQDAIPAFDDQKPYEQMTTQYSLHWVDEPGGELYHTEYLGAAGTDTRRAVAEHLCQDIPADVCVLAWNRAFEMGRIARMAELYPHLAPHLMAIHNNILDLMDPFSARAYYTKEMKGKSSIKLVLPALFPNDPELDYRALEGVHNGGEAASAFKDMVNLPSDEQESVRENLLRYCELDTLAMVRILEKLQEVVEDERD